MQNTLFAGRQAKYKIQTTIRSFIQATIYKLRDTAIVRQNGQLLIEVLVAMAVGGGLLIAASSAIVSVIKQNYESRGSQAASSYAYDLIGRVKQYAASDWHNIYNLAHGSSNPYFMVSSATSSTAVAGQESVLSNDVEAGLVGYWKFDETTGTSTYDSSGNGNVGTLINNPTRQTGTNCQVGECLSFNGSNQYVSMSGPLVTGNSQITIAAWFKLTSIQTGYYSGIKIGGAELRINGSSGGASQLANFIIYTPGGYVSSGYTPSLGLNQWHYVVATYTFSGSTATSTIYFDGSSPATYNGPNPGTISSGPYQIGWVHDYFPGMIDDVRIYNRALSANEISQLYNSSVYMRYFYVDNVNRTNCGIGDITSNATNGCTNTAIAGPSDVANDPSTQKVTAVVKMSTGESYQFYNYVSRSRNTIATQNDWSGGSGYDGPVTSFGNQYSTSTNVTAGKTLALTSNSSSGTLYSSIFDTQVANGAAFNSIVWNGTAANGSSVKFQIATSNSTTTSGGGGTGTIDPVYRYAWNDYIGWLDFGYGSGNVSVQTTHLVGYAYNVNVGEISLDCATSPAGNICVTSNYQVFRDTVSGDLSGWAWNDEIGWISFNCSNTGTCGTSSYKVNVNPTTGIFTGYAWNDVVGWISFNCIDTGFCSLSNYKVTTLGAGGWVYVGPDGTNLTYYTPAPGLAVTINPAYHTNYRYFRYKAILSPDSGLTTSPNITDININWSP